VGIEFAPFPGRSLGLPFAVIHGLHNRTDLRFENFVNGAGAGESLLQAMQNQITDTFLSLCDTPHRRVRFRSAARYIKVGVFPLRTQGHPAAA
jgi:hypothetical protein